MKAIIEPAGSISSEAVDRAMADIVERLRAACTDWDGTPLPPASEPMDGLHCDVLIEAAAEIEWLRVESEARRRSEIETLQKAILAASEAAAEIESLRRERDNWKQRFEDTEDDVLRLHNEKMDGLWPDSNLAVQRLLKEARETALEDAAQVVEGFQVPKSPHDGDLKPRRYPSQTSVLIAAAIRSLATASKEG